MEFDWDDGKAQVNLAKHGVSFQEAASVFDDPLSITFPDPGHSLEEDRSVIIGHSERGRLLFISHVDRENQTHLISARGATRQEKRTYEEAL